MNITTGTTGLAQIGPDMAEKLARLRRFDIPPDVSPRQLAFLSGTRAVFEVSAELHAHLGDGPADAMPEKLAGDLAAEIGRLERFGYWYAAEQIPPSTDVYYGVNLAHVCNLACTYCNVNQGQYTGEGPKFLATQVVEQALQRIPELFGPRIPTIIFYGGEPLLNWETLVHAVGFAEEHFPGIGFQIVTNGTRIDAEKAAFFAAHQVFCIVSIDGPPEIQDTYRPTVGGKPSSKLVEAGITHLKAASVEFVLRATWAPDRPYTHAQVFDYLQTVAGSPWRVAIGLEFSADPPTDDPATTAFFSGIDAAYSRVAASPETGELSAMGRVWCDVVLHADLATPPGCPAGKSAFFVTPGGDFYPCQVAASAGALKIGHVKTGIDADAHAAAKAHLTRGRRCEGCWIEPVCQQSVCPLGEPVKSDFFACINYRHEFTNILRLIDRIGYDAFARNQTHHAAAPATARHVADRLLAMRNLVAARNRHLKPLFIAPIATLSARPAVRLALRQSHFVAATVPGVD